MSISERNYIDSFLEYIKFQKRYSRHTVEAYRTDLEGFDAYSKSQFDLDDLPHATPVIIRSWLASLREDDITPKSINRKISSLRSFYKYQLKNGTIDNSPMILIKALKVNKRLPSFVLQRDIDLLLQHVEFPDTWEGKTEQLLIKIFYNSGLRLSELITLQKKDVDFANKALRVFGKGSKTRVVPLNAQLLTCIKNYETEKFSLGLQESASLLCTKDGKPLYPKYVYRAVKKYLGLVTTNEKKSPHVLRHTFATHLANNGAEINAVKDLLGHASLASTQVYTHNSIDKIKEVYRLAHPKSRVE